MMKKQTFENNIYMKIFNWVYIFLSTSLLFSLFNLPFVLCVLMLAVDPRNALWFSLSLITFGPASIGALATIDEFFEEKNVSPVKAYFGYVKKYFLKGLAYWLPVLVLSFILIVDIKFFMIHMTVGRFILPLFIILIVLMVGLYLNAIYLQVKNPNHGIADVYRAAVYYLARRWYIAAINAAIFAIIPILMLVKPQFGMVITPSLGIFLIYMNSRFLETLHRN